MAINTDTPGRDSAKNSREDWRTIGFVPWSIYKRLEVFCKTLEQCWNVLEEIHELKPPK
ncbi:MAG: hypothetical protein K8R59_16395 [Thermoanaerobaculales bacterium]|nr:hypothetical protein [Thermoanaerobaculales bacterium]